MDRVEVRQYHSALLARGFYEKLLLGEWETTPPDGVMEPPILEVVSAGAYLALGGENLLVPRLLSAASWMVGGVFLYLIAKKVVSPNAALFSTVFYLFVPWAVLPSRAFQPEALMVATLLASIFAILRYHERPSTRRLLVAVVASSLPLLVKPGICLFQVLGVFVSLAICREGFRRTLVSPHLLIFAVLSVLPVGLYYLYGTFVEGFLQGQVQARVQPQLLLSLSFWISWAKVIIPRMGFVALVGALLGVLLFRPGLPRALIMSLWAGYFLFGVVFATHVSTHDYYSLQLVPVVALSLGPVCALAVSYLSRMDLRWRTRLAVPGLFFFVVLLDAYFHGQHIQGIAQQGRGEAFPGRSVEHILAADYEGRAKTYRKIGEDVGHSPRTLFLAPEYGYSLMYHGGLSRGNYWPPLEELDWEKNLGLPQPSTEERFDAIYSEHSPEYFIVVTPFDDYGHEMNWNSEGNSREYNELRNLLTENFPVTAEDDYYVVFDLREKY
jgi:dolichyl-phosphate-mannose-protein mannosyltransferase